MRTLALVLLICLLAVCVPAMCAPILNRPGAVIARPGAIAAGVALRPPDFIKNLNKQTTVEGFYYDGSIPMIINDMTLLHMNKMLPPDSYIPIVGLRPSNVKWGDRISLTGTVERATGSLIREPAVIRLTAPNNIRTLAPSVSKYQTIARINPAVIKAILAAMRAPYAVLIAGGINPANNHIRYWNDLKAMYNILLSNGYPADHITVLFADGVAKDGGMPVNYSATKANISTVFSNLASQTTADNDVYIMLTDHGGQWSGGHSCLCLWGEDMGDTDFAAQVNKVTQYKHMIIQMEQCFSGAFVGPLTKPNRVVMSPVVASQPSWAKATLDFDEFTYWYMSALQKSFVDGAGACDADANHDGKVSIMEAWNYTRAHDTSDQIPQYEDNGAAPCASGGAMPRSGEGAFGAACWLQ